MRKNTRRMKNHAQEAMSQIPNPKKNAANSPDLVTMRFLYENTANTPSTNIATVILNKSSDTMIEASVVSLHYSCMIAANGQNA